MRSEDYTDSKGAGSSKLDRGTGGGGEVNDGKAPRVPSQTWAKNEKSRPGSEK